MDPRKIVLLHWIGRFGNRMFQYAFGCAYAKKYDCTFYIPSNWEGDVLFARNKYCKIIPDNELRLRINQSQPSYDNKPARKKALEDYNVRSRDTVEYVQTGNAKIFGKTNIAFDDLDCMYLKHCFIVDQELIDEIFDFSDKVKQSLVYQEHLMRRRTYDVMHVRRGDIARPTFTGAYSMVSFESYTKQAATLKICPYVVSDDATIRTASVWHAQSTGHRWSYPTGEHPQPVIFFDWFPDFLTIMFARTVLRGNSSFSWWACRLGQVDVYSPIILPKPMDRKGLYYCQEAVFEHSNRPHFVGNYDAITF